MIRGNAFGDHGLAHIFDGRGDQLGDWAKDAQLVRIPGSVNGRLQVKRVWLGCVGPLFPWLRIRSTEPLRVTKPPPTQAEQRANTVVLRVAVQKQYAQENWQTVSRKPMQFFRAWACEQGGVKSFQTIDTWNFREGGLSRISGYVRIDSARHFSILRANLVAPHDSLSTSLGRNRSSPQQQKLFGQNGTTPRIMMHIFSVCLLKHRRDWR